MWSSAKYKMPVAVKPVRKDKSLIYRSIKNYSRQLYFELRVDCVFHFTLRFHLRVPSLAPFKMPLQRYAKKFLHSTAKKFLCFYRAAAKKFLQFPGLKLKATHNQQQEELLLADAKRSSYAGIIFGLYCIFLGYLFFHSTMVVNNIPAKAILFCFPSNCKWYCSFLTESLSCSTAICGWSQHNQCLSRLFLKSL